MNFPFGSGDAFHAWLREFEALTDAERAARLQEIHNTIRDGIRTIESHLERTAADVREFGIIIAALDRCRRGWIKLERAELVEAYAGQIATMRELEATYRDKLARGQALRPLIATARRTLRPKMSLAEIHGAWQELKAHAARWTETGDAA